MDYDLPPWHSGADRPERVLERAASTALQRPEVTRAVASRQVTKDELVTALSGMKADVLAAAGQAEQRYRVERPDWHARFEWGSSPGRWVLLLAPVLSLALLAVVYTTAVGQSWTSGFLVVGCAGLMWLLMVSLVEPWYERGLHLSLVRVWVVCGWVLCLSAIVVGYSPFGPEWLATAGFVPVTVMVVWLGFGLRFRRADKSGVARAALVAWEESVLVDGVLPVLYSKLNEVTPPVHATVLAVREVSSLVRADPLRMHVPTPAGAVLAGLVDQLDGGSFAIAGPRGAGKTNLLRAFCGGRYRSEERAPDLAVLVSAPVDSVPQEFVVHLFAEVCEAVIDRFGQRDVSRRRRKVRPHPLVSVARDHLTVLNYVRTYADEISGKGGFKGFELAGKRAVTMAGRALTYPEVVKRFRGFLSRIAAEQATERELKPGRVVIGIDELDRIGAGEPARRLLNEVKAIFDVQGCYYLVSVSTEAQHDFELSGIGLRSVFDSSFDEVVRVDYLDFEYARKLLRRYVLDLSEQFQALAYVFSGGLARQLVRTARAIVELGREQPWQEIADVVQALVDAELTRACQATADALTAVDDRDGVTDLLRLLDERRTTDLKTYSENLRAAYKQGSDRARHLKDAIAARTRFLATVQQTFTADLTEARMRTLDFNELARARRYAGTNPEAGFALLRDIDRRWAT